MAACANRTLPSDNADKDTDHDDEDADDEINVPTDVDEGQWEEDVVEMETVTIEDDPDERADEDESTTSTTGPSPVGGEPNADGSGIRLPLRSGAVRAATRARDIGSREDSISSHGQSDDDGVGSHGDASAYEFGASEASGGDVTPSRTSFSPHTPSEYSYGSSRSFPDSDRSTSTRTKVVGETQSPTTLSTLLPATPSSPRMSVGGEETWWSTQGGEAQDLPYSVRPHVADSAHCSSDYGSPDTVDPAGRIADANSALQVALDTAHITAAPAEPDDDFQQVQSTEPMPLTVPHEPICHVEPRGSFGLTAPRGSFGWTTPRGSFEETTPSASFGFMAPRGSFGWTAPRGSFGLAAPRGSVCHVESREPFGLITSREPAHYAAAATSGVDARMWPTGDLVADANPPGTPDWTPPRVAAHPKESPRDSRYASLEQHLHSAEETALTPDASSVCLDRWHWLSNVKFASSWVSPECSPSPSDGTSPTSADLHVHSTTTLLHAAHEGVELTKPVLIRGDLADAADCPLHTVENLADGLRDRYGSAPVRIRRMEAESSEVIRVHDLAGALLSDGEQLMSLDLRARIRAQKPTMTYLRRFDLLDVAITRAAGWVRPLDSSYPRKVVGDSTGLTADHIDTSGAFRGPQVGAWGGTCVRVLTGTILCMFVPRDAMADEWEAFARDGPRWRPHGEQRAVLLQPNDQLFFPAWTVSAWYAVDSCVSMQVPVWDERDVIRALQCADWALRNPQCAAGASVGEAPTAVDGIEGLVRRDIARYAGDGPLEDFSLGVQQSIEALRHSIRRKENCGASMPQRRAASSSPITGAYGTTHVGDHGLRRKRARIC